jgi:hypothetical protein
MASDRLARQLLNMTTDPNVADPVKLAAIKDALDRSGLAAKNAVSVEVGISKPFERVFDSIVAGPRIEHTPALETGGGILDQDSDKHATETEDDEIVGEFDDDPLPEHDENEPDPLQIQPVIDVEIVADEYTDAPMTTGSGTAPQIKIKPTSALIWGRLRIPVHSDPPAQPDRDS